jgi:hypothetical protein
LPSQAIFYAISHLYRTLGDYYFSRAVIQSPGDLYCFEYRNRTTSERIYVAWLPTGGAKPARKLLPLDTSSTSKHIYRTERMPTTAAGLTDAGAEHVEWTTTPQGLELEVSESPVLLWAH